MRAQGCGLADELKTEEGAQHNEGDDKDMQLIRVCDENDDEEASKLRELLSIQ